MKQKYRSNPYMDDANETILSISKCLQIIMTVTNKSINSVKRIIKSLKQKYRSSPYMDDGTETILSICKCLQIVIPVTSIGTEK